MQHGIGGGIKMKKTKDFIPGIYTKKQIRELTTIVLSRDDANDIRRLFFALKIKYCKKYSDDIIIHQIIMICGASSIYNVRLEQI